MTIPRDYFAGLDSDRQEDVLTFPRSLVLFPPDDTASNLNPGIGTLRGIRGSDTAACP